MGIKNLMKLLQEEAPAAVKEVQMSYLSNRSIAIDASMALYQFLIAVRSNEGGGPAQMLTNSEGEVTSHINGMLTRTIRFMENGIKPVYVFDGKPPTMKSGELAKRSDRRALAQKNLDEATEAGNVDDIDRFNKRMVRATTQHSEDCKELLRLMGVPVLTAPCEAEASCAELAKKGKIYATGTEDMDALTFGTPILYRRLNIAASKKLPILEIKLEKALEGLGLTHEQFVDLCILCGCDYCDSIRGVGPKKALAGIRDYKTIENFIDALQKNKAKGVEIPEEWLQEEPIYKNAREMFLKAEVADPNEVELKWKEPQVEELEKFLVDKHGFNKERVGNAIERLKKTRGTHSQKRLDSFFQILPSAAGAKSSTGSKRKADTSKKGAAGSTTNKKKAGTSSSAMKKGFR
jgi:flap endonuclease-1